MKNKLTFISDHQTDIRIYKTEEEYLNSRSDEFKHSYQDSVKKHCDIVCDDLKNNVLFVGDSSLLNMDLNNYFKSRNNLLNLSIEYDTTDGVLHRLEKYINQFNPTHIVLSVGLCDIGIFGREYDVLSINLMSLTSKIHMINKDIKISLVSILPVSKGLFIEESSVLDAVNVNVLKTNINLNTMCNSKENVYFVNAFSEFSFQGQLISEYTEDGFNINEKGFKLLSKLLQKHIG